jgi:hypothetical protein
MNEHIDGLTVLEQFDIGDVVSIPGRPGPAFLLPERYLDHLADLLASARSASSLRDEPPPLEHAASLLSEVDKLVTNFQATRNKFYAGPPPEVELKSAQREFDQLARDIESRFGKPRS